MSDTLTFLKTFLRHPTRVGAVAPSSRALVETMVDGFDWSSARGVVEYGPGTGVFTEAVARSIHPEARFIAIEQSAEFAERTRTRCPSVPVYCDSVTNVAAVCRDAEMQSVDAIVCGLPWASFSPSLQASIMDSMFEVLRPGGQFATFAYWQGVALPAGRRFSKRLHASFSSVERSRTAWRNLPPAFVYRCVR